MLDVRSVGSPYARSQACSKQSADISSTAKASNKNKGLFRERLDSKHPRRIRYLRSVVSGEATGGAIRVTERASFSCVPLQRGFTINPLKRCTERGRRRAMRAASPLEVQGTPSKVTRPRPYGTPEKTPPPPKQLGNSPRPVSADHALQWSSMKHPRCLIGVFHALRHEATLSLVPSRAPPRLGDHSNTCHEISTKLENSHDCAMFPALLPLRIAASSKP